MIPEDPFGTPGTPASAPAAARKWNCRSGRSPEPSPEFQNAPPSTTLEATGPDLKARYSIPASAAQCHLLYRSRLRCALSSATMSMP